MSDPIPDWLRSAYGLPTPAPDRRKRWRSVAYLLAVLAISIVLAYLGFALAFGGWVAVHTQSDRLGKIIGTGESYSTPTSGSESQGP